MPFEQRPGSGSLFPNRSDNPKAPAYKGELCLEDGRIIRLAGWVKEGSKGKFLSISIDKPLEKGGRSGGGSDSDFRQNRDAPVARNKNHNPPPSSNLDDEIPF